MTSRLPFGLITDRREKCADAIQVLALNFECVVFDRAASSAGRFELREEIRNIVVGGGQSFYDGDRLATFAVLNCQQSRLLLWRKARL